MVWQSSRGKAISLLIGAYVIMTVMVGSCTVILLCCQNTLWRQLFQNHLKKQLEANVVKNCCGNCNSVKNNMSCYKGCKCQGTVPRCTNAVYMKTSDEKEI